MYWRWRSRPHGGRPKITEEIRTLIGRMAEENSERIQAVAEGDLSERARQRALSLVRDADLRLRAPQGASTMTTAGRHRDSRLRAPGTILKRTFRDQSVMVRVLAGCGSRRIVLHRAILSRCRMHVLSMSKSASTKANGQDCGSSGFLPRFLRIDSPVSSMRKALWTSRSRMLSAMVGSPICSCQ
jgi:hypothetical protein